MTTPLTQLKADPRNARRHGSRNRDMIGDSIRRDGFGRSVLVANDGTIIAGNATVDAAAAAGIDDAIVVETDGTRAVVVKRTDVAPDSPQFARLSIADNRAAELAEWQPDILADLAGEVDLAAFWDVDELARLRGELPGADEWADAFGGVPDGEKAPFQQMTFTVSDAQAEGIGRALRAAKAMGPFIDTGNENNNGNALTRVCESYLTHADR